MKTKEILDKVEYLLTSLQKTSFEELKVDISGESILIKKEKKESDKFSSKEEVRVSKEVTPSTVSSKTSSTKAPPLHIKKIKSDLVGVFFFPKKNIPREGAWIDKGQVIGIIHCLGIDNYLHSPYAGNIRKMYVGEGDIVDYGKELFDIEE
jgi:acetyl-CoA carboxylase biotin carboxyl carrier protein